MFARPEGIAAGPLAQAASVPAPPPLPRPAASVTEAPKTGGGSLVSGPRILARLKDIYIRDPGPVGSGPDAPMVDSNFVFEASYGYVGRPETFRFAEHLDEEEVQELRPWFAGMLEEIRKVADRPEFQFRYPDNDEDGVTWRIRKDADPDEPRRAMYICRQIPKIVPPLAEMDYPTFWPELFICEEWKKGGLVVMVSATGQGKSTTLGAIVRKRLEMFGGHARTVEDPIELPLAGSWGPGECHQTEIPKVSSLAERNAAWSAALAGCMRGFPAIPDSKILLVGEIRDPTSAVEAIMAAASGHLVLTTVHGGSVIEGVRRVGGFAATALGEGMANDFFGGSFLAAIYQRMELTQQPGWRSRRYKGTLLVSKASGDGGAPSPVANLIRTGDYGKLNNEIDRQQARMRAVLDQPGARSRYENSKPLSAERITLFRQWFTDVTEEKSGKSA